MKSLIEAVTATKTRTKMTPKAISETVSALLRLYRLRLRKAILNRLPMGFLATHQPAIFKGANNLCRSDNSRVMGGENKCGIELIPHFLHEFDDRVRRLVVQIRGRLLGQKQLGLSFQRAGNNNALLLATGQLVGL